MSGTITECRVCASPILEPVIDLGSQPWCGNFLKEDAVGTEPLFSLRLVYCERCCTPQLDYTVPKEYMFSDHTYLSNITYTLSNHFKSVAQEVKQRFFRAQDTPSVLDIGSNDGLALKHYQDLGFDVLGVESAKTAARLAREAGIPTENAFFDLGFAERLGRTFDVVSASGVFFHLEDLHSVVEGIKRVLAHDGIFVVQFLYMKRIIENRAFDQIYHEHLLYYTLKNIATLLNSHGMEMFDAYLSSIHGGSIIGFITHKGRQPQSQRLGDLRSIEDRDETNMKKTYLSFAKSIEVMKVENLEYLERKKSQGKTIFGFGAPAKGNTLLNYFNIGGQYLDLLVEKNRLRKNLYSPGQHLKIVMEDELAAPPDVYYVLAWNFKDEILAKNAHLIEKGVEFYFPVDPLAV
ncbi:MAG: class I SAM-dependent methyltransferase [Patescibacteria group bacterium]